MTVARDAVLEGSFSSGTPATLSFTPVGTPRGITVVIAHGVVSTDLITSVTYGGVTMTRINTAVDTAGEAGRVYTYFLGASIPTGTQTVSIVHTGSADVKWFCVQSVTAAADTEVVTSGVLQAGNQADPQIALNTGATSALRNSVLYSGLPTPTTDFAVLSGMEAITAANTHDFGAFCALFGEQTTVGSGSFTIGYTSLTDDVAMAAIAIQEVAGGAATVTPAVIAVTASLPTPAVLAASTVTPAAVAAVAALPTPTILAASLVAPATIPVVTALPTPTIVVDGGPAVVTPATISVLATLPTPSILAAAVVTPAGIVVSVTLPTPVVAAGALVTPATISLIVALPTPTTLAASTVTPATITVLTGFPTPLILIPATVTPATIGLIVALPTPTIIVAVPTFWQPAPIAYTLNPVAYVPVGADDDPPW